jgi:internalin A
MKDLRLDFCFALQNVDALRHMPQLRSVHAPHGDLSCEALRRGFVGLNVLDELDLSHSRTTHMGFDTPLPRLRKLEMRSCPLLHDLGAIGQVKALHSLDLSGSALVGDQNLESLDVLVCLQELFLNGCVNLTNQGLCVVGRIRTLNRLGLFGCRSVTDLSPLADLTQLEHLDLQGCTGVRDETIHSLSGLKSMRGLNLSQCNLTDAGLFAVAGMLDMHSLNLDTCQKITDVGLHALSSLANLQQLDLSRCRSLKTLKPLSFLTELKFVNLSGCVRVSDASLANLIQCKQLKTVYANHCKKITKDALALILH